MEGCYVQFLMNQTGRVPFYVPPHNHNCCELVYYISGTGKTVIDGQTRHYAPGSYALMPPKTVHDETAFTDTHLVYVGFLYNASKHTFQPGIYADSEHTVKDAILRITREWEQKAPFYSFKMNNILQEILILFFRKYHPSQADENSQVVLYIKQRIDEDAIETASIHDLADTTGYSYDWIRHLFKAYTGQSLSRYILSKKLQRAALLLRGTQKSVADISMECRFSSVSRFIGYFKREVGMTPAQFRKTAGNKGKVQWSYDV